LGKTDFCRKEKGEKEIQSGGGAGEREKKREAIGGGADTKRLRKNPIPKVREPEERSKTRKPREGEQIRSKYKLLLLPNVKGTKNEDKARFTKKRSKQKSSVWSTPP